MAKKISEKVSWVGKIDWDLKHFHGDELSTHHGSSYNSYLIRDEKVALIDTVWLPYHNEFVARLQEEIDLSRIDYIVMLHNEVDHSGSLPELMKHIPDVPIYCTKKGESILRGHYHKNWNYVNVKTGDTLPLGETTLTFIEAPMLHWPDTMFAFLSGEDVLFSNDGFGQHLASDSLFDDEVDSNILFAEAEKYYVNIINPFNMMASKKVKQILDMGLNIRMICPSHGVIWRKNIGKIIGEYQKWSTQGQSEQITIVYDTMWKSTEKMALAIADGIREAQPSMKVKTLSSSEVDKNDILVEIGRSKAILVGSPTINNGISYATAGLLEMIRGLKFKGKKAAAFGSYGWSGEGIKIISEALVNAGFELLNDGINTLWVPDSEDLSRCRHFGADFVKDLL